LVAVVANIAHHVDVGGLVPGSMATHTTEIFQEGVRVPPVWLYRGGELQRDLLEVLVTNVRTPKTTRGDIIAQLAANSLGVRRLDDVLNEWGSDYFRGACESLITYAEQRARVAISELPDGTATFTDYLEHDGHEAQRIPIVVTV